MSLDQDTITQQLALLATHRGTLAHLLQQAAQYGGDVFAPPQTVNGIAEARAEIARIKVALREGGVQVEDDPDAETPPASVTAPAGIPVGGGPRIQSTVTVQDNQGTVVGTQFNQPNWAVTGNVTNIAGNQQIIQPALTQALHQLRAPVGDFVGREREIDQLVEALSKAANDGTAAAISGVRGMGGIGKTELAYMVAQQFKDVFPDAQLLVELRGASGSPLTPEQALQQVIHSFEREAKLPDDLSQLKGIYSSVLTGKRVLILADDAKDAGQVRPLLPPEGCALLVTSRNRFSLPGMVPLDLEMLPPEEAEGLLLTICPRIGEHAGDLARLCGYLPLALRVSASLLETNDARDVKHYLAQLKIERLKYLSDPDNPDDSQASVEASLRLSYDALEPEAQSALCQMSVFPASCYKDAAETVVVVERDVVETLELLRRRSLLEWEDAPFKRYSLHELVRVFAAARLTDADAVWLRYARHYAQVVDRAGDLYYQGGASLLAALALFDLERTHIDAGWGWAMAHAGDQAADALCLDYANATVYIGDLRYDQRRERIPQMEAALAVAQQLKNRGWEAAALGNLGLAYADLGDARTAIAYHERDLAVAREIGDRREEGNALGNLGNAYYALGDARQATDFYEQALVIARKIGDRRGEANALGNLGNAYYALGDAPQAIAFYEQARVIAREIGDRRGEASALGNLGNAYYALGDAHKAIAFYEQRLVIAHELGDRRGEGSTLGNLGGAYAALGDAHKAIAFYKQALVIARELGDRRGEGSTLGNLGAAYADLGDTRTAISFYEQHLAVERELGDRRGEAIASWNLGLALKKQGHLARAVELMQVYVDYLREIEHPDAEKRAAHLTQLRQQLAGASGGTVVGKEGA